METIMRQTMLNTLTLVMAGFGSLLGPAGAISQTTAPTAGHHLMQSSDGGAHGQHATAMGGAAAAPHGASPSTLDFMSANARMHADMDIAFTGDANIDFARGMIPHHEGAVAMAQILLDHGADPDLRALAQSIIDSQSAEIAMLRGWLEIHAPSANDQTKAAPPHAAGHGTHMAH